jgi:hypothetical protein
LSRLDAEELFACLQKLDAIHDSVKSAAMPGKPSVMAQCVEVYRVIERVLKKEYVAVKRWQERNNGAQGDQGQEEPAPSG